MFSDNFVTSALSKLFFCHDSLENVAGTMVHRSLTVRQELPFLHTIDLGNL